MICFKVHSKSNSFFVYGVTEDNLNIEMDYLQKRKQKLEICGFEVSVMIGDHLQTKN